MSPEEAAVAPEARAGAWTAGALSPGDVLATAALVALPLSPPRAGAVADLLNAWIPAAAGLSARMRGLGPGAPAPVTAFTHASPTTEEI